MKSIPPKKPSSIRKCARSFTQKSFIATLLEKYITARKLATLDWQYVREWEESEVRESQGRRVTVCTLSGSNLTQLSSQYVQPFSRERLHLPTMQSRGMVDQTVLSSTSPPARHSSVSFPAPIPHSPNMSFFQILLCSLAVGRGDERTMVNETRTLSFGRTACKTNPIWRTRKIDLLEKLQMRPCGELSTSSTVHPPAIRKMRVRERTGEGRE